jgi:hypothetical protein
MLEAVDRWRQKQSDSPTRATAIRRLAQLGLAATPKDSSTKVLARGEDSTAVETKRKK